MRDRTEPGKEALGGDIELLLASRPGQLKGLRVVRHEETPGLADFIESDWIRQFESRPPLSVDTVTGATITSNAIKRAVSDWLLNDAHDTRDGKP